MDIYRRRCVSLCVCVHVRVCVCVSILDILTDLTYHSNWYMEPHTLVLAIIIRYNIMAVKGS